MSMYCEHANECPTGLCTCEASCPCRERMCPVLVEFQALEARPSQAASDPRRRVIELAARLARAYRDLDEARLDARHLARSFRAGRPPDPKVVDRAWNYPKGYRE